MSLLCSPSPRTHPGLEKHRKLNPGLASMPSWHINRFSHIPFLKFSSSFYTFQMSGSVWNCLPLPGTKIEATALCSLPHHALFLGCHPLNQISVHWVSYTDLGLFWKKGGGQDPHLLKSTGFPPRSGSAELHPSGYLENLTSAPSEPHFSHPVGCTDV